MTADRPCMESRLPQSCSARKIAVISKTAETTERLNPVRNNQRMEFFNKLFKILEPLSDKKQLKKALNEYDVRTSNYKNDEVLNIIDYIRNNFSSMLARS